MKRYTVTRKFRNYILARQRDEFRKSKRKGRPITYSSGKEDPIVSNAELTTLIAPERFLLHDNLEQFLNFIKTFREQGKTYKHILVDFKQTFEVSHDAIGMFASVLYLHKRDGGNVQAEYPIDQNAKRYILQSGLFNHHNGKINGGQKSENIIVTKGENVVEPQTSSVIVEKCLETITGRKNRFQPLQRMIIEMMANSVNHAFGEDKNSSWLLAVDHSKQDRLVRMVFVDNGKGIADTLYKKIIERIASRVDSFFWDVMEKDSKMNLKFIKEAFDGSRKSSTKLPHRGKGLPTIFRTLNDNKICNLHVVTNNVYWNFRDKVPVGMNISFEGTYYYWELNETCII